MTVPYELTKDGFEKQWQVNYVAPFVLTTTLLPLMLTTAGSCGSKHRVRVVNVASNAAFGGPKTIQFDDVNMTDAKGLMELWYVLPPSFFVLFDSIAAIPSRRRAASRDKWSCVALAD